MRTKLLIFKIIIFFILNTHSFSQEKINIKNWEGSYIAIGYVNSSSKTTIRDTTGANDHYALNNGTKDKDKNDIIF